MRTIFHHDSNGRPLRTFTFMTVVLLALLLGCRGKSGWPQGVMDTATFTRFLTDAYLIEGYQQAVVHPRLDSMAVNVGVLYNELYDRYQISPADVDSTMAYYVRHPQLYEDVYVRVLNNLKSMKQ